MIPLAALRCNPCRDTGGPAGPRHSTRPTTGQHQPRTVPGTQRLATHRQRHAAVIQRQPDPRMGGRAASPKLDAPAQVVAVCWAGVYTFRLSWFDVVVAAALGVIGFFLVRRRPRLWPPPTSSTHPSKRQLETSSLPFYSVASPSTGDIFAARRDGATDAMSPAIVATTMTPMTSSHGHVTCTAPVVP